VQERAKDLKERTRAFALSVVRSVRSLPSTQPEQALARQLLRSGTAVGANYRAARLSRSTREFVARLAVVLEESDESVYWLGMLAETAPGRALDVSGLLGEARELRAIFAASLRTAKSRQVNRAGRATKSTRR
jgi:four helix bundle protein